MSFQLWKNILQRGIDFPESPVAPLVFYGELRLRPDGLADLGEPAADLPHARVRAAGHRRVGIREVPQPLGLRDLQPLFACKYRRALF